MARQKRLENMSLAELTQLLADIERIRIGKQNAERSAVREKLARVAKEHGFDIHDILGRKGDGGRKRGKVAVKYRDNAGNTWTGRGRMPRWMMAAVDSGKKREDFSVG